MSWIDIFITLGITVLVVEMAAMGYIPAVFAAILLILFVSLRAIAKAWGGFTNLQYWIFIALFCAILIFFLILNGGEGQIAPLLIHMLTGGFISLSLHLSYLLVTEGLISFVFITIIVVILLRWLGFEMANLFLFHTIFTIASPIFILLIMISHTNTGNWNEAVAIGGMILAVVVLLEAFYVLFLGVASSGKRR